MIKLELNRENLSFITLIVLVLLLLGQCSSNASLRDEIKSLKAEVNTSNSNLLASQDSVEVEKNRNGYLQAEINSYEISVDDLKKVNAGLVKEYTTALSLNRNLKNVNTLLRAELGRKDSIIASGIISSDSTFTLTDNQDYGDGSYRNIKVSGKINDSIVDGTITLDQNIRLWMAIEKKDGLNTLKLSTRYPFDNFDIQGIDIINTELNTYKKKSRWTISAGVGLGIVPSGQTGLAVMPTVGVMLGWSPKLLQF